MGHFSSATHLVSQLRMAPALPSLLPLALSSMPAAQVSAVDFTARMSPRGNTCPGSHRLPRAWLHPPGGAAPSAQGCVAPPVPTAVFLCPYIQFHAEMRGSVLLVPVLPEFAPKSYRVLTETALSDLCPHSSSTTAHLQDISSPEAESWVVSPHLFPIDCISFLTFFKN